MSESGAYQHLSEAGNGSETPVPGGPDLDVEHSGATGSPRAAGGRTAPRWTPEDDGGGGGEAPAPSDAEQGAGDGSVITQYTGDHRSRAQSGQGAGTAGAALVPKQPAKRTGGGLAALMCCFGGARQERDEHGHGAAASAQGVPLTTYPANPPPAPHRGKPFIPPLRQIDTGKKTIVLDLDETLVHSSFKPVPNPDYIIPVDIDGRIMDVYVLKRPWVDQFIEEVGQLFEVVVFTASLSKYADPLLDLLDGRCVVRWRLFRDACYPHEGNYVKDLTCLGRELRDTVIVDNSPHSYVFQPQNAIPIRSFIDDLNDNELMHLLPLMRELSSCTDVVDVLAKHRLNGGFADEYS